MKNTELIRSIILAISVVVAGYFIGNLFIKGKENDRFVQVKGLSERQVAADLAVWPINVNLGGNDLQSLKPEIERQNREIKQFFVDQGFTDQELMVGASTINDSKASLYDTGNETREFRYIANSDFTIRTKDIEKLQKTLSKSLELISKGILISSKNSWQPIEYTFTGLNEIKPVMIEEATKNAREVAEKFAQDSNSTVSKIKSAQQGQFSISDLDQNTSHIKVVRVVSTIDYQLED